MPANMALKRAAKASRRKAILAEKRKAEQLAMSLTGQVQRAATLPIRHCVMTEGLFDIGMGSLVLTRGVTDDSLYCGFFLLDAYCLGVKDAFFRRVPIEALEMLGQEVTLDIEPSYGRKLLRALAAWSRSLGFAQAPDYLTVEALFGDVNPEACDVAFQFGREGQPLPILGPRDSLREIKGHVARLGDRAA